MSLTRHFSENLRKSLPSFDWWRLKSSLTIWLFNFDYLPDEDGKKVDAKNEAEDKKFWKNEFDFWILHIKLGFMEIFMKIWEKKIDLFLKIFLTNRGKNKNVNEKKVGK